ncbi:MAG: pyridoxal phosphate-dependent aminotransferase [Clostridia bacterium]|nr:pyridoxal phosphate-dependent aminotransferase [Clostridia bacterium]
MYNQKSYELGSKRSVIREIFEYAKTRAAEVGAENVFDFSIGNPSVPAPQEVQQALVKELTETPSVALHGYTSAQGDANVRKTISNNLKTRFNADIPADFLYMTCGAAASLTITLKALYEEGDEVIVFAPFFTEYRVFVEGTGAKLVVVGADEKTLLPDFNALEKALTPRVKAVIINSPNNPSGVVYREETVVRLCELLKKKSAEYGRAIYLISDEPYRELVYDKTVRVPFITNYYENAIVCYSYSKSLSLPGERIGYIAVSPKAAQAREVYLSVCGAGRTLGYVCAPALFQRVVAACDGLTADLSIYKKNRELLYNGLTECGFTCVYPDGAFYLFMKTPVADAYEFCEKAKAHDLLLVPSDDFGVKGFVRIAYCVQTETIERALPKFSLLAKEYGLK